MRQVIALWHLTSSMVFTIRSMKNQNERDFFENATTLSEVFFGILGKKEGEQKNEDMK